MKKVSLMFATLVSLLWISSALALDVKLQWDPNTESDLAGYRVYYTADGFNALMQQDVKNQVNTTIAGLDPSQNYSFAVVAYNTSGIEGPFSKVVTTADLTSPDVTPPVITNVIPVQGSSLSGVVSLSASVADDYGISRVEFYVDGTLQFAGNVAPYMFNWNSTAFANGSHILMVKAYDLTGNFSKSSDVSVAIFNDSTAPSITLFSMSSAANSTTVPVTSFTATDNKSVTGYLISESSAVPVASDVRWTAFAPASYAFSTVGLKTVFAWAKDAAGNISSSRSAPVTLTLTINDALTALRIVVGMAQSTNDQKTKLDVAPHINGNSQPDGKIDISDVVVILGKVTGKFVM